MFFKRKEKAAVPTGPGPMEDKIPDDYNQAMRQAVVRFYSAANLCFDKLRIEAAMGADHPPMPPVRYVTESIACGLAVDVGPSYQRVNQKNLDDWGVSFDQMLMEVARQRAKEGVASMSIEGMVMVHDETAGPCLWLCPELAESTVGGRPVMVGQRRTCTILAREDDAVAVKRMAEFCDTALQGDEWVESVTPTRWTGQKWESVTWEQLGVPTELDRIITRRYEAANYGRVRPVLKQWYESRDECPITAAFQVCATKDGHILSQAASVVDGDTEVNIIPMADRVFFVFSDGRQTTVLPWEVALEHCQMTAVGLSPEWYRVSSIPSHEELASLASSTQ